MVDELRRRFASPIRTLGIVLAVACGALGFATMVADMFWEVDAEFDVPGMMLFGAAGAGVCLLAIPLRSLLGWLRHRHNGGFKATKPIGSGLLVSSDSTPRPLAA
jgi:hypothetical protein